jgi:hypothetical protein
MNFERLQSAIRTFLDRAKRAMPLTLKISGIMLLVLLGSLLFSTILMFLGHYLGFWAPPLVFVAFIFTAIFAMVYHSTKKED